MPEDTLKSIAFMPESSVPLNVDSTRVGMRYAEISREHGHALIAQSATTT
jgi:hypothetical protein